MAQPQIAGGWKGFALPRYMVPYNQISYGRLAQYYEFTLRECHSFCRFHLRNTVFSGLRVGRSLIPESDTTSRNFGTLMLY